MSDRHTSVIFALLFILPLLSIAADTGDGGPAGAQGWMSATHGGDLLGWNVSSAGDVNGDGYTDLLVGAPGNDSAGTDAGAVYVFLGGPWGFDGLDTSNANITLSGQSSGDMFGWDVSSAGDVNGDGTDEILVGAPGSDINGTNSGAAYLYDLDIYPYDNTTYIGGEAGDRFGSSLCQLGDIDADGFGDIAIGAYLNDTVRGDRTDQGAVYVFHGNDSLPGSIDVLGANLTLTHGKPGDWFGYSLSGGTDINGNGRNDLAVGAPGAKNPSGNTGAGATCIYSDLHRSATIFHDEMEDINGWWVGTQTGASTFGYSSADAHSGSWCMRDVYDINDNEYVRTNYPLDLTNTSSATLTFWHRYQTDSSGPLFDDLDLMVMPYPYGPMDRLASYDSTSLTGWTMETVNLTRYVGQKIFLRFQVTSDVSFNGEWRIDDVRVSSANIYGPAPDDVLYGLNTDYRAGWSLTGLSDVADLAVGAPGSDSVQTFSHLTGSVENTTRGDILTGSLSSLNVSNDGCLSLMYNTTSAAGFPDSFESTGTGSAPAGWTESSPSPTTVTVVNTMSTDGTKCTELSDSATNKVCSMEKGFTARTSGMVEFDWRTDNEGTFHASALIYNGSSSGTIMIQMFFGNSSGAKMGYWDGYNDNFFAPYKKDTWYHIGLDINCSRAEYDIYVDGALRARHARMMNSETYFDTISFETGASTTCVIHVDNVTVHSTSYRARGSYHSATSTTAANITSVKGTWDVFEEQGSMVLNLSRDGGATWITLPRDVPYYFDGGEPSGNRLVLNITLKGDTYTTPQVKNIRIRYGMTREGLRFTGATGSAFGSDICEADDYNANGHGELVVTAPSTSMGNIYLFDLYQTLAGPVSHNNANGSFQGESAQDRFGHSVAAIGNLSGNGQALVLAGSPYNDAGGTNAGRAYLLGQPTVHHFYVTSSTGAHAGGSFTVNVTARDISNATMTSWSGLVQLRAVMSDGITPASGPLYPSSIMITGGYGELGNISYHIAETLRVKAVLGSSVTGIGPLVTITPGPIYEIKLAGSSATLTAGTGTLDLNTSSSAVDMYGNLNTSWGCKWTTDATVGSVTNAGLLSYGTLAQSYRVWCNSTAGAVSNHTSVTVLPAPVTHIDLAYSQAIVSVQGGPVDLNTSTIGYDTYGNVNTSWSMNWGENSSSGSSVSPAGVLSPSTTVDTFWVWCNASMTSASNHTLITLMPGALDRIVMANRDVWLSAGSPAIDLNSTTHGIDPFGNLNNSFGWSWSTDAPGASIDAAGIFTPGTLAGDYTVWCNSTTGPVSNSTAIHVMPAPLHSISLLPGEFNAVSGGPSIYLNSSTHGYDTYGNLNDSWAWSWSTNATGAQVNPGGLFTPGSTAGVFSVNLSGPGGVCNTSIVHVLPDDISYITVIPSTALNTTTDDTILLTCYGFDRFNNSGGKIVANWSMSKLMGNLSSTFASSTSFHPMSAGTLRIRATYGKFLASSGNITIQAGALDHIRVSPFSIGTRTADDTLHITAHGFDRFDNPRGSCAVNWALLGDVGYLSNSTSTATDVILTTPGSAMVEATIGAIYNDTSVFTVLPGATREILLEPGEPGTISTDLNITFNATGRDRWNNLLGPINVTWSVSGGIGNISQGPSNSTILDPTGTGVGKVIASLGSFANMTSNITVIPGRLFSLDIVPAHSTVPVSSEIEFHLIPRDHDGNTVELTSTTWTTTDGFVISSNSTRARVRMPAGMTEGLEVSARAGGMNAIAIIDVIPSGSRPEITGTIPDQIRFEDSPAWSLDMTPFEPAGMEELSLYWYVTGLNSSMITVGGQMNNESSLTFIPVKDSYGSQHVTFWMSSTGGLKDSQKVWINLTPVNDPPMMDDLPDLVVHYGEDYVFDYSPYISDIDNGPADMTLSTTQSLGSANILVNGLKATFNFPESFLNKDVMVTLSLSDGTDEVNRIIGVTVTEDNPPLLLNSIPDVTIHEGEMSRGVFMLNDFFNDPDRDIIFFSSRTVHVVIDINNDSSVDISSPSEWTGTENITFRAIDPRGALAEDTVAVHVLPLDDPPIISGVPDLNVHYDSPYTISLRPYISDVDTPMDQLAISSDCRYANRSTSDPLTMVLEYPQAMLGGPYSVAISVTDGNSVATQSINVTVSDNWPPQLEKGIPDIILMEDMSSYHNFQLRNFFFDRDHDEMFYSYGQKNINIRIDPVDTSVDIILPRDWNGFEEITFRATDTSGSLVEDSIRITVTPVNDPPVLSPIPDQIGAQASMWKLDLTDLITDVDNNITTLKVQVSTGNFTDLAVVVAGTELVFFGSTPGQGTVTLFVSDMESTVSHTINVTVTASTGSHGNGQANALPWYWVLPFVLILLTLLVVLGIVFKRSHYGNYTIEEAFLVNNSGLLIAHRSRSEENGMDMDKDILSGMLKVIQDFVKDSFRNRKKGEDAILNMFKYGDTTILIEQGDNIFLAIFFTGTPGRKLEKRISTFLEVLERKHGKLLKHWDGDMSTVPVLDRMLGKLVKGSGGDVEPTPVSAENVHGGRIKEDILAGPGELEEPGYTGPDGYGDVGKGTGSDGYGDVGKGTGSDGYGDVGEDTGSDGYGDVEDDLMRLEEDMDSLEIPDDDDEMLPILEPIEEDPGPPE